MAHQSDIELEEAFAQQRMSRATFSRLVAFLRPYRRVFALNLLFTLLATVSQLLGPKFIQIGIDRYLAPAFGSGADSSMATRGILLVSAIYGKPAQDDERVVAAQRRQEGVEVRRALCRRATCSLAWHRVSPLCATLKSRR